MAKVYIECRLDNGLIISGTVEQSLVNGVVRKASDLSTPYEGSLEHPSEPLVVLLPASSIVSRSGPQSKESLAFHRST